MKNIKFWQLPPTPTQTEATPKDFPTTTLLLEKWLSILDSWLAHQYKLDQVYRGRQDVTHILENSRICMLHQCCCMCNLNDKDTVTGRHHHLEGTKTTFYIYSLMKTQEKLRDSSFSSGCVTSVILYIMSTHLSFLIYSLREDVWLLIPSSKSGFASKSFFSNEKYYH